MVQVSWRNRVIAWPFSCFDTIGSPNAGYFTYDSDQSGQRNQNVAAGDVPGGSAGIERTLAGYLNLAGWRPADQPLGPGTDYFPVLTAGVPIGGMTTGAAGQPFDPNYHTPRDTIDDVNLEALAIMGPGVAFTIGTSRSRSTG